MSKTERAEQMKKFVKLAGSASVGAVLGGEIYRITKKKQQKARNEKAHVPCGPYEAVLKKPLDIVLSVMALTLTLPVMAVTALLVRIKLGSPVLFVQERPGKDGKLFKLYKFRSMTDAKDRSGKLLSDEERLTDFGKKLRSTSLDELPELFNIIKGDMAIVGPRPLLTQYLELYNERQARRHEVRPGLTGYAQVSGRNTLSWKEKFEDDVEYVDHITFWGDLRIILKTVKTVLRQEGIHSAASTTVEYFTGNDDE